MCGYDNYLSKETEKWTTTCEPHYDGDGDPINCIECDNTECEEYTKYHDESDFSIQAEMDESILWNI